MTLIKALQLCGAPDVAQLAPTMAAETDFSYRQKLLFMRTKVSFLKVAR
jgi:hypothetical protein